MNNPKKVFADRLKTARVMAGWDTAQAFATYFRVPGPRYRHWEAGDALPRALDLVRLCTKLHVTPNDLLMGLDVGHNAKHVCADTEGDSHDPAAKPDSHH